MASKGGWGQGSEGSSTTGHVVERQRVVERAGIEVAAAGGKLVVGGQEVAEPATRADGGSWQQQQMGWC